MDTHIARGAMCVARRNAHHDGHSGNTATFIVFVGAQHATPHRPAGEVCSALNAIAFYAPYGAGRSMLRPYRTPDKRGMEINTSGDGHFREVTKKGNGR